MSREVPRVDVLPRPIPLDGCGRSVAGVLLRGREDVAEQGRARPAGQRVPAQFFLEPFKLGVGHRRGHRRGGGNGDYVMLYAVQAPTSRA
jgi:hypothetical protein